MFVLSIALLIYTIFIINRTSSNLEVAYNNRKFNDEFGLEYFEDIDDITDILNNYSNINNLN